MPGAKHNQMEECMLISWPALVDKYEHREEEMTLVIQAQGVLFSTMDTIHRNPINAKAQVVLDLVNPIDVWNL